LHTSQCYSISRAYNKLTEVDMNEHQNPHKFVWLKVVPLKVSIFAWRLFRNRVPTKDNLLHRRILTSDELGCTTNYGEQEDIDHLFVKCDFFCRIWYYIFNWLGFYTASNGRVLEHIYQFDSL